MPVSTAMIKTLEDGFLRNQALDRLNLRFRRAGKEAPENIMAQEMTHIVRNILFSGIIPVDLLPEFNSLALELGELNLISDASLGKHAWIIPYIPLLSSDILSRLREKHLTKYNYTDSMEIFVQSITAMVLAYQSQPMLFATNPTDFEALSNTWLKTLLTFNCKQMPELIARVKFERGRLEDELFHSTVRNLVVAEVTCLDLLPAARSFCSATGSEIYRTYVTAFESILSILPTVFNDNAKFRCEFHTAVSRLRYIKENVAEFQTLNNNSVIQTAALAHSDITGAVAVATVIPTVDTISNDDVVIGIDVEVQKKYDAEVALVQLGITNIMRTDNETAQQHDRRNQSDNSSSLGG
jgi:hypothetical protein